MEIAWPLVGRLIDLLGSITRFAVPYCRGARDLITGHIGERTVSGKRIGRRSLRSGIRRGLEKDVQSEEEIAGREIENVEVKHSLK